MAKHPAKNLAKKMQDKKETPNPKAPVPRSNLPIGIIGIG